MENIRNNQFSRRDRQRLILVVFFWSLAFGLVFNQPLLWASPPKVVITVKPIHSLVSRLMQEVADPKLLIKGSVSPHAYSLKPSDARLLQAADLIIWVGEPLEVFLKKSLASLAQNAQVLTLLDQQTIVRKVPPRNTQELPEADAHAIDDKEASHRHTAHSFIDAHIWLDPINAIAIAKLIAPILSTLDKSNKKTYERNSRQLIQELTKLHLTLKGQLQPIVKKPYLVFHDAYRLFELRYGLTSLGAITLGADRQPGVRRLNQVRALIVNSGAKCVFSEPQFKPKWMKSILRGSTAKSALLDPIGIEHPPGPQAYFNLMLGLSHSLVACLQEVSAGDKLPVDK
ncbi:zinc ABC transporter substrate-binding protein [Pseudomonadota bacterium]